MPLLACLLWLLAAPLQGASLDWRFALEPDHVAHVEILTADGLRVARLLAADGSKRSQIGWRPDLDPAPGQVAGRLEELWLAPGSYTVREILPDEVRERVLSVVGAGGRGVLVELHPQADGVVAWRRTDGRGHDGLAWAPAYPGGVTWLTVGAGEWRASQLGAPGGQANIVVDG